jgi:hypothetical protein
MGLATETFVGAENSKETLKIVLWMAGISVTVTGITATILFNLFKLISP